MQLFIYNISHLSAVKKIKQCFPNIAEHSDVFNKLLLLSFFVSVSCHYHATCKLCRSANVVWYSTDSDTSNDNKCEIILFL